MAETRRRVAYRRRHQNRFSMFLVTLVVVMIMVVVAVKSMDLQHKIGEKKQELDVLEEQIEAENARALEIMEFGKAIQTKGYIESIAREKLGLIYEDEIMFKQEK